MAKLRRLGKLADTLLQSHLRDVEAERESERVAQRQRELAAQAFADRVMSNPKLARAFSKAGVNELAGMPISPFAPSDEEVTADIAGTIGKATTPGAVPGDEEVANMLRSEDVPLTSFGADEHTGTGLPTRQTFRPSQNGELPSTVPNFNSVNLDSARQAAAATRARLQPQYDVEHSIDQTYRDETGQQFTRRVPISQAMAQGGLPTERTAAQQGAYEGGTKVASLNTPGLTEAEAKQAGAVAQAQARGQGAGHYPYETPTIFYDADNVAHAVKFGPNGAEEVPLPDDFTRLDSGAGARRLRGTEVETLAALNTAEDEGVKVLTSLHALGLDKSNDLLDPRWTTFAVGTLKIAPQNWAKADLAQRAQFVRAAILRSLMGARPSKYIAEIYNEHVPDSRQTGEQLFHVLNNVMEQVGERRSEMENLTGHEVGELAPVGAKTYQQWLKETGVSNNPEAPDPDIINFMNRPPR